jgi:hypothetical protein
MVKESDCEKPAAPSMTRYLLPCSCSRRIAVGASQAGGSVRCPACGGEVAVPRLGQLATLDRDHAEPDAVSRPWDAARAWLLVGVVVACGAVLVSVMLRGWRSAVAPLDEQAVRSAVAAAPIAEVHEAWLEFERLGIVRPPVPEEERRVRQARALAGVEAVAWLVVAAGAGTAAAAAIAVRRGRMASRP